MLYLYPYDGTPVPVRHPESVGATTVVIPPNDLSRVEDVLKSDPGIGCVILEPTGGHCGVDHPCHALPQRAAR
ncbi:MAG: hypothetical protein U0746_18290 [Gemmataceae bacterium]